MDDVWELENEEEKSFSALLSMIIEDGQNGDKNAQKAAEYYLEDDWDEINIKCSVGNSVWYVWWMDGVRRIQLATTEKFLKTLEGNK